MRWVFEQNSNEGPIFNGAVDGHYKSFRDTLCIEGYDEEDANRLLEKFQLLQKR